MVSSSSDGELIPGIVVSGTLVFCLFDFLLLDCSEQAENIKKDIMNIQIFQIGILN
jgi:hypothetical protein